MAILLTAKKDGKRVTLDDKISVDFFKQYPDAEYCAQFYPGYTEFEYVETNVDN